jgi:hypothetical protein
VAGAVELDGHPLDIRALQERLRGRCRRQRKLCFLSSITLGNAETKRKAMLSVQEESAERNPRSKPVAITIHPLDLWATT